MIGLRALCYADLRALVNGLRRIRASPGRSVLWVAYALILGFLFLTRLTNGAHTGGFDVGDQDRADYLMTALLLLLVVSFATGFGRAVVFRDPAEARFIIGSPIAAPLAIAYLQVRGGFVQGLRFLASLVTFFVFFGLRHIGAAAAIVDVIVVIGMAAASAAITAPRRLLAGAASRACVLAGIPLGLAAIAPALRDLVLELGAPAAIAGPILASVPAWHPGRILIASSLWSILGVIALNAVAIGWLATAGRDAYPELYALSIAAFERLTQVRPGSHDWRPTSRSRRVASRAVALSAPAGVLIFVWKSVVEFRYFANWTWIIGGAAVWCGAGALVAHYARSDVERFTLFVVLSIALLMLGFGFTATGTLIREFRRPLFWLSSARLSERLGALGLAGVWRPIVTFELIAVGFVIGGASVDQVLFVAVGLPAIVVLVMGVGFAAFGFSPSATDTAGPVAFVRTIGNMFALIPPLVLFAIGSLMFGSPVGGLLAAALLAIVQAGALLALAAWRLDGRTDRLTV